MISICKRFPDNYCCEPLSLLAPGRSFCCSHLHVEYHIIVAPPPYSSIKLYPGTSAGTAVQRSTGTNIHLTTGRVSTGPLSCPPTFFLLLLLGAHSGSASASGSGLDDSLGLRSGSCSVEIPLVERAIGQYGQNTYHYDVRMGRELDYC